MTLILVATILAVAAWMALLMGRGRFWRADQRLAKVPQVAGQWPSVAIVIPARNEAPTIGQAVTSALGQDYPGRLEIVVVDDHSDDGTGAEAEREAAGASNCHIISADRLPAGWTGKLWAQHNGLVFIRKHLATIDYILFTDADITHPPDLLCRLAGKAVAEQRAMVSLMVLLSCSGVIERLLVPAFVFFFQKLFPFPLVNDPHRSDAAAAGGCILVERTVLDATGGVERIHGELIDDCALARQIKAGGRNSIWLGLTEESRSLRRYPSLGEFWEMVSRTAFTQLNHSAAALVGTVLAMLVIYAAPPLAVGFGIAAGNGATVLVGGIAMTLMLIAYRPTLRLYGQSWAWGVTLPVAGILYTAMTLDSARRHWRGVGGAWKGRVFSEVSASRTPRK